MSICLFCGDNINLPHYSSLMHGGSDTVAIELCGAVMFLLFVAKWSMHHSKFNLFIDNSNFWSVQSEGPLSWFVQDYLLVWRWQRMHLQNQNWCTAYCHWGLLREWPLNGWGIQSCSARICVHFSSRGCLVLSSSVTESLSHKFPTWDLIGFSIVYISLQLSMLSLYYCTFSSRLWRFKDCLVYITFTQLQTYFA